jgi:CRISPR-associated protein Cas5d
MYAVSFEVSGPMAMFARPDSGSTPTSYPVPTWSALKGMFEAVARIHDADGRPRAYIHPTHVEICRPVRFERYTTNYGGPLRRSIEMSKDANLQLIATVLADVCYRVFGDSRALGPPDSTVNWAHALKDRFKRRLGRGQSFYAPTLGWRDFAPDYFGPLREGTARDRSVSVSVPSLLRSVFDSPEGGRWGPVFDRDVEVREGLLRFGEEEGRAQ